MNEDNKKQEFSIIVSKIKKILFMILGGLCAALGTYWGNRAISKYNHIKNNIEYADSARESTGIIWDYIKNEDKKQITFIVDSILTSNHIARHNNISFSDSEKNIFNKISEIHNDTIVNNPSKLKQEIKNMKR